MTETYLILAAVFIVIGAASLIFKKRTGYMPVIILGAALLASLIGGMGFRFREIVEGSFAYLDNVMWVLCGGLLTALLYQNGTFSYMLDSWMRKERSPFVRMTGLLLLVGIPGMLTGSALASVASTGVIVGKYLMRRGLSKVEAVEIVAGGSFLGMILPPLCTPAMLMIIGRAESYNPSFEGYFLPLLALGLPALLIYAAISGKRLLGKLSADNIATEPQGSAACMIPLVVVFLLVISHNFLYSFMPFLGYPLIYIIGFVLALIFPNKRINPVDSLLKGIELVMIPASLMFAVGSLNEVMWMTGVNGNLNTLLLETSGVLLFVVPVLLLLVSGRLLGQPFAWALCAIIPAILNGSGFAHSPLRLLAASAILGVAAYRSFGVGNSIFAQSAHELDPENTVAVSVPMHACVPVIIVLVLALGMGFAASSLSWLMV